MPILQQVIERKVSISSSGTGIVVIVFAALVVCIVALIMIGKNK